MGAKRWECALGSISSVGMSARGFNPFNGSLRRSVVIDGDRVSEHFVVNNGDSVAAAIRQVAGL